jgi:hypothetical protein
MTMSVNGTSSDAYRKEAKMFIVRALEKILSDKDVKRSQHAQLKLAAEAALRKYHESTSLQIVRSSF